MRAKKVQTMLRFTQSASMDQDLAYRQSNLIARMRSQEICVFCEAFSLELITLTRDLTGFPYQQAAMNTIENEFIQP